MLIHFEEVTLRRGKRVLLAAATGRIHRGDHIGLVGHNGCGKSTLLALLRGEMDVDAGNIWRRQDLRLAHVAQETPALPLPALDYVLQGDERWWQLHTAIQAAETAGDGMALTAMHARMAAIDGYTTQARAATLMQGLGFSPAQLPLPVAGFSGGWRMRLNLARALMAPADLLLLDEPTNHLDLEAVLWLEQWLQHYPGALVLVSHDRDFLDRCIRRVWHLAQGQLHVHTGNYTSFEQQRSEQLMQQQQAYHQQQRQIAHMEAYIRRFRAKASKARQAQSRIKALERMQRLLPAHTDSPFRFDFPAAGHMPTPLLECSNVDVGYGDQVILRGLTFSLLPGERLGLLGKNGAGKSTLMRLLAGETKAWQGYCRRAESLRIGYFAQHQLEQLDDELSPFQHLMMQQPTLSEQACRDVLGRFGFGGDAAMLPVAHCSGGERARLVLALMVQQQPQLLLLDEPTNHLDMDMRHALTLALQSFDGAVLLVSHDRHLLRTVCDALWLIEDGSVQAFDGDLDDYARLCEGQGKTATEPVMHDGPDRRQQRRQAAQKRQQQQPLRQRIRQLEQELETLQRQLQMVEQELADPALYEKEAGDRIATLSRQQKHISASIAEREEAWLVAQEMLE